MRKASLLLFVLSALLIAMTETSAVPAAQTGRIPQFENAHVKVWKSTVLPNQPLPPHRHDHGRVIVAMQGAR